MADRAAPVGAGRRLTDTFRRVINQRLTAAAAAAAHGGSAPTGPLRTAHFERKTDSRPFLTLSSGGLSVNNSFQYLQRCSSRCGMCINFVTFADPEYMEIVQAIM